MGVKTFKPITPGRRFMIISSFEEITKKKPEKSLITKLKKKSGRNNHGHITVRHQGGGHKRKYRIIDFKRNKDNIPAKVAAIEYDPNRSARIALLNYADGEKRYIIAPKGLKVGMQVISGEKVDMELGNCMALKGIPTGTDLHCIEMKKGKGGQLVRSAGSKATLVAKEGKYGMIKMPSSEVRKIHLECRATIGQVGNIEHNSEAGGKAGRNRWKGKRPTVRGVAMNPADHPHGGGEGKTSGGRNPVTPWGQPTRGYKTRKKRKWTNKFIVKSRTK